MGNLFTQNTNVSWDSRFIVYYRIIRTDPTFHSVNEVLVSSFHALSNLKHSRRKPHTILRKQHPILSTPVPPESSCPPFQTVQYYGNTHNLVWTSCVSLRSFSSVVVEIIPEIFWNLLYYDQFRIIFIVKSHRI